MADSFSKRLADKLQAAKAYANPVDPGTELAPVSQEISLSQNLFESSVFSDLPAPMQDALQQIQSRQLNSPVGLFAVFKKWGSNARAKMHQAEASEISALQGLLSSQVSAYKQDMQNKAELKLYPEILKLQYQLKFATDKNLLLAAAQQAAAFMIGIELAKQAAQKGLSFELYLKKLEGDLALDVKRKEGRIGLDARKEEFEQDLDKDRRLKTNEREHERLAATEHIEMLTTANLATRQMEKQLREELRVALKREDELLADVSLSERLQKKLLSECRDEITSLKGRISELTQGSRKVDTRETSRIIRPNTHSSTDD